MLMTGELPLTPLAEKLLEVIRTANGWVGRADIARRLGRRELTPYDVELLTLLETDGYIEVGKKAVGIVRFQYQYRAK